MARRRQPRTWLRAGAPALAWLVPVGLLVGFNLIAMGTWTGYDTTNESTGFTWDNFRDKWEFMTQQMYDHGLFFIAPFAVLGLVVMYRASWKLGLLFTLWIVPGGVIYTSYYWGLQRAGLGYLRFFLTLFPPLIVAACWYMRCGSWGITPSPCIRGEGWGEGAFAGGRGSVALPIACGLIVAIASAVGVRNALPLLLRDHATNVNLAYTMDEITRAVPRGSHLFADRAGGGIANMLNFLQFKGDFVLYSTEAFTPRPFGGRREPADPDQPTPLQPARRKYLVDEVYRGKSIADLTREQQDIVSNALNESKRVFVVLPGGSISSFRERYLAGANFDVANISRWKEPAAVPGERTTTPLQPQGRGPNFNRQPQSWQVIELKPRPATSQPSVD